MPTIAHEDVTAFASCVQQLDEHGALAFNADAVPEGDLPCPGYRQQEVAAIRETISFTYADADGQRGAGSNTPVDTILANQVERSVDRLLWKDEADMACPFCGVSPRLLSEQLRPRYSNLGGGGPDALFTKRRRDREQVAAQKSAAGAAERQAVAAERQNELLERQVQAQEEANRIEALKLNGAGEPEQRGADVAPRPARKRSNA